MWDLMLKVIRQVVIDKGHRELITLPCINSPVKAVAKVQSQEGINICLLMNPRLCGCYIGTHPPGTHSLQTDKFFRTASNDPLATVLKTLVPIAKTFEEFPFSSVSPSCRTRWKGGMAGAMAWASGGSSAPTGSLRLQLLPQENEGACLYNPSLLFSAILWLL